jgi:PKD repeat protein
VLDKNSFSMLKLTFSILCLFLSLNILGQGVGINIVKRGTACRPLDVWVKNTTTTPNVIKFIYEWGDGTSNTYGPSNAGDTVHHQYAMDQTGYKTIILTSIAKDGTSTANTSFMIYSEDEARIISNQITCNGSMQFTENSVLHGSPDSSRIVEWEFNDGTPNANDSIVNHTFPGNGNYNVTMRVNNGCGWSQTQTTVTVATMPDPGINYTKPPCRGGNIALSMSNPLAGVTYLYNWNLGDGTNSTQSNPIHLYPAVGSYNITLNTRVLNGDASCNRTANTTINILDAPYTAFNSNYTPGCDSVKVTFVNNTTGATSYLWDFGNGLNSTSFDTTIVYKSTGTFTVNLLTTNNTTGCSTSASKNIVVNTKPHADFNASNACQGDNVSFTDASTGSVNNWKWDFKDASFSNQKNPVHLFSSSGDFNVELVISNGICFDSVEKIITIRPKPQLTISGSVNLCSGGSMSINYTPIEDSFITVFEKGDTSKTNPAIHTYKNNSLNDSVFQIVTYGINSYGCSDTAISYARVHPSIKAGFSSDANNLPSCGPDTINFISTSTGPAGMELYWDFGDSSSGDQNIEKHIYYNNNHYFNYYEVKLFAYKDYGQELCVDSTKSQFITLNPKPNAAFKVDTIKLYPPSRFVFTAQPEASALYKWNINGTNYTTPSNIFPSPNGTFSSAGSYLVNYTVQNQFGCTDSSSTVIVLADPPPAILNLSINTLNGCPPLLVNFSDNSTGTDTVANKWDFGDGYSAIGTSVQHEFYREGNNKVTFRTRNASNGELLTKDTVVTVFRTPSATFKVVPKKPSVSDEAIYCSPTNPDTSSGAEYYTWYFGDGDTSILMKPSHRYIDEGSYMVTLSVRSNLGCVNLSKQTDTITAVTKGQIESPNAFMPRMNGSGGNQLQDNDYGNYVFSPISQGVLEYKLDIYDRWGERLFTSLNRNIGWDGYYHGKLCKQDVYVWKVTGKFANGKGFSKTGTVTLFHSKK